MGKRIKFECQGIFAEPRNDHSDGKLSFEEFTSMVANTDIIKSVLHI